MWRRRTPKHKERERRDEMTFCVCVLLATGKACREIDGGEVQISREVQRGVYGIEAGTKRMEMEGPKDDERHIGWLRESRQKQMWGQPMLRVHDEV